MIGERFNWRYAVALAAVAVSTAGLAAWGYGSRKGDMEAALTCTPNSKKLEVTIGNRQGDPYENAQLVLMLKNNQGQEVLVAPRIYPSNPDNHQYLQHSLTITNSGEPFRFSDPMQITLHRGVLPTLSRRVQTIQETGERESLDSDFEPGSFDTPELLERYHRTEILDQTEVRCKPAA